MGSTLSLQWLFGIVGLVIIITNSYLFEYIREKINKKNKILGILISCPQCLGFWLGLGFSLLTLQDTLIGHFICAGLVSLTSYIIGLTIGLLKEAQDGLWLFQNKKS